MLQTPRCSYALMSPATTHGLSTKTSQAQASQARTKNAHETWSQRILKGSENCSFVNLKRVAWKIKGFQKGSWSGRNSLFLHFYNENKNYYIWGFPEPRSRILNILAYNINLIKIRFKVCLFFGSMCLFPIVSMLLTRRIDS